MAINRCPSMPYSCSTLQCLSRRTRSYAFSRSTKFAKTPFGYSQDFSRICLRVKIWSVVLRPGQKPHWPSSNFDFTISRHFLLRHLAYISPGRPRNDIPRSFVHSLRLPFLYIGMITPVCQSYDVFFNFSRHLIHPCQPKYAFI